MLPRQDQPPLGVGESASVPSAAAIANAIFDATGVRFRELPFTPERILAGLRGEQDAAPAPMPLAAPQPPASTDRWKNPFAGRRGALATAAALCVAVVGVASAVLPWRAIAPIARPDPSTYSAATIARGQQLAALGDCAVCHTVTNGVVNAGGRPIETPFGIIYATNITPDVETGIGAWSYPAFERAMREGIHRDGRHLYPAFPYTHFAKTSDADLQALYAYLMAQPAVRAETPANTLAFPFNLRPLMAGWNALFHQPGTFQPDADEIGDMESRRLSGRGPRPLRRLPFAAQCAGGGKGRRLPRRRFRGGLGGAAADVAVACADPVERRRTLRLFANRRIPPARRGRGADGACREGTRCPARPGHPRHGGLSRVLQRGGDRQTGAGRARRPTGEGDPFQGGLGIARSARGSMRAPARFAMRSAARRCSAAGRRWR